MTQDDSRDTPGPHAEEPAKPTSRSMAADSSPSFETGAARPPQDEAGVAGAPRDEGQYKKPKQQFRRPKHDVHGWIVLDKPVGMTSTQAVGAIKRLFQCKRAGHAGTLDPLASGC